MKRYIRGFDGLRTLGVLGVILYHLFPKVIKGGFLGVVLFFVLSGYLVTDLLLQEQEKRGKIALKSFYIRRFKRLYPSLLVVFSGTAIYSALFQREFLNQLRMTVISGLLSFNNWWQISKGGSYFAKLVTSAPFSHLYSLAIEAQFYLLWPIIVALLLYFVPDRNKKFWGIFGTAILSAFLMAILFRSGQDPTRVYYGTDTRLFSILLGSSLAFIWPSHRLHRMPISQEAKLKIYLWAAGLVGIIILFYLFLPDQHWFTYRGGLLIFSFLSVFLVGLVAMPQLDVGNWFSNPLFDYIGKRSYEIYLWQTPVFALAEAALDKTSHSWGGVLFQVLIILVLSEGTYQLVRKGNRYFSIQGFISTCRSLFNKEQFFTQKLLNLFYLFICFTTLGLIIFSPDTSKAEQALVKEIQEKQKELKESNIKDGKRSIDPAQLDYLSTQYDLDEGTIRLVSQKSILMIGDSMVVKSYDRLVELFPKIYIDAEFGRVAEYSLPALENLLKTYPEVETIFVGLGTNENEFDETISLEQIDSLMELLENKEVYWQDVHLKYSQFPFEDQINEVIHQAAKKYDNLHLVKWYDAAEGNPSWFEVDGFHPNEIGSIQYARVFAEALASNLKE